MLGYPTLSRIHVQFVSGHSKICDELVVVIFCVNIKINNLFKFVNQEEVYIYISQCLVSSSQHFEDCAGPPIISFLFSLVNYHFLLPLFVRKNVLEY